jgi:catechol 2,3-dioxygenase-like lactoylglutathione lyase family enzyme
MEPHIDVITLAVGNLERSLEFYRDGLGLDSAGVIGTEYHAVANRAGVDEQIVAIWA